MNLDVKIASVATDGDAPGEIWLKERGFRSVTTHEVCEYLKLPRHAMAEDSLGFPVMVQNSLPTHFVLAAPSPSPVSCHYWIYRFHPHHKDSALLFKLTHGGGV